MTVKIFEKKLLIFLGSLLRPLPPQDDSNLLMIQNNHSSPQKGDFSPEMVMTSPQIPITGSPDGQIRRSKFNVFLLENIHF